MTPTIPTTHTFPDKSRATLALVLAAASWLLCSFVASIPALVLATFELKGIRLGRRAPGGRGMAIGAVVLAGLNIVASTVLAVFLGSVGLAGYRAGSELLKKAEERITLEASDGTAQVEVPGLWQVPAERDHDYIVEANAPFGVAAFNAVRIDKDDEVTLDTAAKLTLETLRAGQPSLQTSEERRTSYGALSVIEIDTSLTMDKEELRTYFAFVDGAHGIYQLTGTTAKAVDESLGKVIKGIFASFQELGPPRAARPAPPQDATAEVPAE